MRHVRFDRLFAFALLLLGIGLLGYYSLAPESHIARPLQGFGIETNLTMIHVSTVLLALDVNSGDLWLIGDWKYINQTQDLGKPFSIMFALPFTIRAIVNNSFSIPGIQSWKYINTNITDIVASAVTASFSSNLTRYSHFQVEFVVAKTYVSSSRGAYTIVLPLNTPIDGESYFPGLLELENYPDISCCAASDQIDVYLTIPESARNIQPFPALTDFNYLPSFSDKRTIPSIHWQMTQRTQVSVAYVDPAEQSRYDFSIIAGSLLLGSGISCIGDWLKEISMKRQVPDLDRKSQRKRAI